MSAADRVYRALLVAYPPEFRASYETQMAQLFRDRYRESNGRIIRFWAEIVADVARSAPALRLEATNHRWSVGIQPQGGVMKTMAILAILIGVLELANSAAEAWAGGIVRHGGYSLAGGVLGALAALLVVASAIALLRRAPGAAAMAQGAAIACLAVFATIVMLRPMFSVFASALGIGFPIAMLIYLRSAARRGPSAPSAA